MNFFCKNEWTIAIHMKFPIINAISQKWHLSQPPPPSRPSPNWPPPPPKKKNKTKQTNKQQQHGNTTWRRSCMLDLKMKENKRVLLENWRSTKHEEWWIYPLSLSLGKFQPYYSINYWPNLPLFLVEVGYRS